MLTTIKKFGPWLVLATVLAFTPVAVVHWAGVILLVATTAVIAAISLAKYNSDDDSLSKRAKVPGFGRFFISLRSVRTAPGFAALPVAGVFAAAAVIVPGPLKSLALILFGALLLVMLWPLIKPVLDALPKTVTPADPEGPTPPADPGGSAGQVTVDGGDTTTPANGESEKNGSA
jgi:hypothetical protein